MKVIHVARKPLVGTVAQTALKYGTGGLNIDRSRIGTSESLDGGAYAQNPSPRPNPEEWRFKRGGARSKLPGDEREGSSAGMYQPGSQVEGEFQQPAGRWPANLILEHKPGCKKLGTRKVEGHVIRHYEGDKANRAYGFYIVDEENRGQDQKVTTVLQQPDIVEDVYECVPDCPCVMLDEQGEASGAHSAGFRKSSDPNYEFQGMTVAYPHHGGCARIGDDGGISRFFKQVGGKPIDDP